MEKEFGIREEVEEMVVKLEDLSREELVEMNKRAIVQITKLVEEKQKLENQISRLVDENNKLKEKLNERL